MTAWGSGLVVRAGLRKVLALVSSAHQKADLDVLQYILYHTARSSGPENLKRNLKNRVENHNDRDLTATFNHRVEL